MTGEAQMSPVRGLAVTVVAYCRLVYIIVFAILQKIIFNIIFRIPAIQQSIVAKIEKKTHMEVTTLSREDWGPTITSFESLKSELRVVFSEFRKRAVPEGEAFNTDVINADGSSAKLFDFMRGDRPLVVNFGSCT